MKSDLFNISNRNRNVLIPLKMRSLTGSDDVSLTRYRIFPFFQMGPNLADTDTKKWPIRAISPKYQTICHFSMLFACPSIGSIPILGVKPSASCHLASRKLHYFEFLHNWCLPVGPRPLFQFFIFWILEVFFINFWKKFSKNSKKIILP